MKPNPVHRLPAPLEAGVQRLKLAAREAAERTIESLGLAALASTNAFQRDGLLGAQFELNRKSAVFVLTFNDAFDERVLHELGPRAAGGAGAPPPAQPTDWAELSLVEDKEVEAQISAERFGMEIAHACEWELRELDGYVGALLADAAGPDAALGDRNPLRPDLVGHAMIRGIEAVSDRAEIRKVLSTELGRSLGALLRVAYADVVAELRNAGVQPLGMTVRNRPAPGHGGAQTVPDSLGPNSGYSTRSLGEDRGDSRRLPPPGGPRAGGPGGPGWPGGHGGSGGGSFGPSTRAGGHGGRGTALGSVDPALMALIRRVAWSGAFTGGTGRGGGGGFDDGGNDTGDDFDAGGAPHPLPRNLIRAHREELRQAAPGALDHMVIDVIGFMFDQILADPKVPPQMARQIARLQLPVLRAALGDPGFFSSHRHPVRRFVNRIASLGAGFDDYDDEAARAFLAKVKALVHEVVEGDFEQIELYEQKLAALEAFTVELAARNAQGEADAAALLAEKEDQQRLRQLYAQRLKGDLKDVAAPGFLREFLSDTWSQVLLRAAEQGGPGSPLAQRMRNAGREVFLSVQPKPTPAHRKAFLAELPKLMQDLTEGMNLIHWPEDKRRAFFGQLMPAHAEALKRPPGRTLDINLMARQVEGALQRPLPSRDELRAAPHLPVLTDELPQQLSAEEARRVGLVDESAIDWNAPVDIDLDAPAAAADADPGPALPGVPAATGPAEPMQGRALADNVHVGYAYQMDVGGKWQKVRLSHVSPGRSFFIFTHGLRQRQTVSLTQRMLVKLCEAGRFKAYESAWLIERATARARKQLAALGAGGALA